MDRIRKKLRYDKDREAAGYNREVCIDKLEFDEDGRIVRVKPTHKPQLTDVT